MIEILSKAYISSQLSDAIVFSVLIVVLLVNFTGILGKQIRERKCRCTGMKSTAKKKIFINNMITYCMVILADHAVCDKRRAYFQPRQGLLVPLFIYVMAVS